MKKLPIPVPGANYDTQNERRFRDEVERELANKFDQRGDFNLPMSKRLMMTSADGTRYVVSISNSGQLIVTNYETSIAAKPESALAESSVNQSVPNNTLTNLVFDVTLRNDGGWRDPAFPTRIIVPASAKQVRVGANVNFAASALGTRTVRISKNGAIYKAVPFQRVISVGGTLPTVTNLSSGILDVVPGDYFEVSVIQDSGAALDVVANPTTSFHVEAM